MSLPANTSELAAADNADWWTNCSTAELKHIVSAGVAGGDRFIAAVREIERRSQESAHRASSLEAERKREEARKERMLRLGVALAVAVLAVLAVAIL